MCAETTKTQLGHPEHVKRHSLISGNPPKHRKLVPFCSLCVWQQKAIAIETARIFNSFALLSLSLFGGSGVW